MRALLFLPAALTIFSSANAQTENHNELRIELFPCGPAAPPIAVISDLRTGRGIRSYQMDSSLDKTPPCGGQIGKPEPIGAFPLQNTLPQLVKVRSDNGQCSGALISSTFVTGARAVITAAHCVFGNGAFFKNVRVLPGYQSGKNSEIGEILGSEVLTFTGFMADKQNAHDIAVIKLESSVPSKYSAFGLMPFPPDCQLKLKRYGRPHYNPTIQALEVQAMAEGVISSCFDGTVVAGVPTGGGSSGSAVVDYYTRSIFAVHSAGNDKYSYEAPITRAKICAIFDLIEDTTSPNCSAGN